MGTQNTTSRRRNTQKHSKTHFPFSPIELIAAAATTATHSTNE